MSLALGLYVTAAGVWAVVWGGVAAFSYIDWRDEREKGYRPEKVKEARGNFLGGMFMFALSPIWPVPTAMFTIKGVQALYRETRRALKEQVMEAIEKKNTERDEA